MEKLFRGGGASAASLVLVTLSNAAFAQFSGDEHEILWAAHGGEEPSDQYGWQCEAIGDLDGDGASEIVVSAPFHSGSGPPRRGKVYVHDGATGDVVHVLTGERENGGFGFRLYAAGDFDEDGTPDYVITEAGTQGQTAPDQTGPAFRGHLYVISGATHEPLLVIDGPDPGGRFGMAAAVLDDLDGDGVPEIVAGACQAGLGGELSGAAWVFRGGDGSILRTHAGPEANALFGNGITRIDDVTGDGVCEYAIGAFGEGPERRGRVRVYEGAHGKELYTIDPSLDERGETAVDFGRFFLSQAGDVDADGVPDLYVADWFDRCQGNITGRVWLVSAAVPAEGEVPRVVQTIDGTEANEWLGFGRGFPDVDGDGCNELLICSDGIDRFAGALGLYSGRSGQRLRWFVSTSPQHFFAYDACSPGDLNGDGFPELVVTSAGAQAGGEGRFGSTYVFAGIDFRATAR